MDNIFAYETNGFGGRYVMDDANVPVGLPSPLSALIDSNSRAQSLLSLPYLGFLEKTHPAYVATRKLLLSKGNPYFAQGANFSGTGYAVVLSAILYSPTIQRPTRRRLAPVAHVADQRDLRD